MRSGPLFIGFPLQFYETAVSKLWEIVAQLWANCLEFFQAMSLSASAGWSSQAAPPPPFGLDTVCGHARGGTRRPRQPAGHHRRLPAPATQALSPGFRCLQSFQSGPGKRRHASCALRKGIRGTSGPLPGACAAQTGPVLRTAASSLCWTPPWLSCRCFSGLVAEAAKKRWSCMWGSQ